MSDLTIEHNGQNLTNFITCTVHRSIKSVSGSFSFTTSAGPNGALPMVQGDSVKILADGFPITNGFIEKIGGSFDSGGRTISAAGRDLTADIIDSTVGKTKEFKGGLTLEQIMVIVLSDLGLSTSIQVLNTAGVLLPFSPTETTSANIGQTVLNFFEGYAQKRQVLLTTDGLGNIVLARGALVPTGIPLTLFNLSTDLAKINNIISSNFSSDFSKRFNSYTVQSQSSALGSILIDTPKKITGINANATDSDIRDSRVLEFKARKSSNAIETQQRADWENSIRRANSLKYTVTVQGFGINGIPFQPNVQVQVLDDAWGIKSFLLVTDVTYEYSVSNGSTTTLEMTYPDAYQIFPVPKPSTPIGPEFDI